MLESDRKKAAELLIKAEAERKPILQLSKTWPEITIEDAYAIQTTVYDRVLRENPGVVLHSFLDEV